MKNKVKEIMDNYKKEVKKLDEKYDVKSVKKPNTKELENKIQYEKDFITRLEFEGAEINANLIKNSKERLDKAIKEKEEIDSKYQEELLKREEELQDKKALKNSTVVLESGREVKMSEKDKIDKATLKDKAIRDLTKESQEISKQLLNKSKELESKRKEWQEFEYKYEKDENGKTNPEPINKEDVLKIHAEFDNIKKEMSELNNMQKECNKYLEELKTASKENKDFMEAWKKSAKNEKEQKQTEPTKTEPEKTEPTKTESTKTDPEKAEPTKTKSEKTEPTKTESEKTEPTKTESTKTDPEKTEPTKTEPTKTEDRDIYSNSFIHINCSKGEAEVYLSSVDGKQVIGNINEIIENRKSKFERLNINEKLKEFGVESRINRFMMRRKINPVILEAIQEDEGLTDKYIEAVVNNDKFPFNYKLDLENSSLPRKEANFMNRLALKESKIDENEIIGAERLHTVRNIFRSIKNKGLKKFKEQKEQKRLPVANEKTTKKNKLSDELKKQTEEQDRKYDEAYNKLSPEQQENIKEISVSDLQRLGIDYTTACGVLDKYGHDKNKQKAKEGEKEKIGKTHEKQSEQKEDDIQTI